MRTQTTDYKRQKNRCAACGHKKIMHNDLLECQVKTRDPEFPKSEKDCNCGKSS